MAKLEDVIKVLSPEDIEMITRDYDAGMPVRDIMKKYSLQISSNQLNKILPPIEGKEQCPYCKVSMHVRRHRGESSYHQREFCLQCGHMEHWSCKCINCEEAKQSKKRIEEQKEQERLDKIRKYWFVKEPVRIEDLDEKLLAYLGILLQLLRGNIASYNYYFKNTSDLLCPTTTSRNKMVSQLFRNDLLLTDSTTPIKMFSEEGTTLYDYEHVKLKINVIATERQLDLLMKGDVDLSTRCKYAIWVGMAAQELVQYFRHRIERMRFYNPDELPIKVFVDICKSYSVRQGLYLVFLAVNNANRKKVEYCYTKEYATEVALEDLQKYVRRAQEENWQLREYNWPNELRRSIAARYIYDKLLKLGPERYCEVPNEDWFKVKKLSKEEID